MRQRYTRRGDNPSAAADRAKLQESVLCVKHNRYYMTHIRIGARVVRNGCGTCAQERYDEAKARRAMATDPTLT